MQDLKNNVQDLIAVPQILIAEDILSLTNATVYSTIVHLAKKHGQCFHTNEFIAKRINLSVRTIQRIVTFLVEKGFIVSTLENNSYRILTPLKYLNYFDAELFTKIASTGGDDIMSQGVTQCHGGRHNDAPKTKPNNRSNKENTESILCKENKETKNTESLYSKECKENINIVGGRIPKEGGRKIGKRINPDMALTPYMIQYAKTKGMIQQTIELEFENFLDYWLQRSDGLAYKLDWVAAWRTWVRKSLEFKGTVPVTVKPEILTLSANSGKTYSFTHIELYYYQNQKGELFSTQCPQCKWWVENDCNDDKKCRHHGNKRYKGTTVRSAQTQNA